MSNSTRRRAAFLELCERGAGEGVRRADGDVERLRRTRAARSLGAGAVDQLQRLVQIRAGQVAAVESGGASERDRRRAAVDDRWVRTLHRLRLEADFLERVVRAVEAGQVFGPHTLQDVDDLVGARTACREVLAEDRVLLAVPADTDAQDDAPVRQHVGGRDRAGGHERVDEWQQVDAAAEAQACGVGRQVTEQDPRVEAVHPRAVGPDAGRAVRVVGCDGGRQRDVVAGPHRLEAELVGAPRDARVEVDVGVLAVERDRREAEVHRGHPDARRATSGSGFGELRELVGDQLRLLALTAAGAPFAPREHRLPPVQLLEAEGRADDLLGVARFRVDVLEARERRAGDGAVPEVVGRARFVDVPGGEVLAAGTAEQVGACGVDQVLLRTCRAWC